MTTANSTERRAIVCAISADHAFALGSFIAGFQRYNSAFDGGLVVFHDGLTPDQQAQLCVLWPQIDFRRFGRAVLAERFADHSGATAALGKVLAQYSPMIFAKFELPDLLTQYDKCVWLDVDMLVQGTLTELWDFDGLAWRPLPEGAFARRSAVMAAFAGMRGDGTLALLNGGVVGMGPALRGQVFSADLYAMAARLLAETAASSVDELALYFVAASRGLSVHMLDQRYNHPVVAPGGREALLVHAIGPDKFWNSAPLQLAYPEWAKNLQQWLVLGGAGHDGPQRLSDVQAASPDAALKAARNRAYWQHVYAELRVGLSASLQVDLQSDRKDLRFFYAGENDMHLRLIRQANERRIGVEVHFPDDPTLAPALFARLDQAVIPGLKTGTTLALTQTRQGWAYGAVVPVAMCAPAISTIAAALDQATSRAKS